MSKDTLISEDTIQSKIDRSMQSAGLLFSASAIVWLIIGSFFGLVSAIKLHIPTFLSGFEWFTYGRTQSVFICSMAYGWSCNAIFGVGLWIIARLGLREVRHGGLMFCGGLIWNLSLSFGIFCILLGQMTSLDFLEMPGGVFLSMLFSYALIGISAFMIFKSRLNKEIYISQLYAVAGFFWFPWFFSAALFVIYFTDVRGTVQSVTHGWYAHNFFGMWLTPMGLAAAYYFIPKLLKRPINKYYLAPLGFWSLALFYSWGVGRLLINGPVPVWIQASGTIATVLMFVPALIILINVNWTVIPFFKQVLSNYKLRFAVFGAFSFTVFGILGIFSSTPDSVAVNQFTYAKESLSQLGNYAFFSMLMFGSLYFILPKFVRTDWPSKFLINFHFLSSSIGITVVIISLWLCGNIQGELMSDPNVSFLTITEVTQPYLVTRTFALILLLLGHLSFAFNFLRLLFVSIVALFEPVDSKQLVVEA
jgi:cytochrome c oxidase cbb3-type subunit 1